MKQRRILAALTGLAMALSLTGGLLAATALPAEAAAKKITKVSKPTIAGTKAVGKTLTGKPDKKVKPATAKRSYQWLRDGDAIDGATSTKYKLVAADRGTKVSFRTCYTKAKYAKKCVTSKAYTIGYGTFTTAAKPTISGTTSVGSILTAKPGTSTPTATSHAYQWLRDGQEIAGATKATYQLAAADQGKAISVTVSHQLAGYTTKAVTSAATSAIAAAPVTPAPENPGPPTISNISPNSGKLSGGEAVTITGTNLSGATVTFTKDTDSMVPTWTAKVMSTSATKVVLEAPVGLGGVANVKVTTTKGSATTKYTYAATNRQMDSFEQQVFAEINKRRTDPAGQTCGSTFYPAVPAIENNLKLNDTALMHAKDVVVRWDLYGPILDRESRDAHKTQGTTSMITRQFYAGFNEINIFQNLAKTPGWYSASGVVNAWMGSAGHCGTIMAPENVSMGIGVSSGDIGYISGNGKISIVDFDSPW